MKRTKYYVLAAVLISCTLASYTLLACGWSTQEMPCGTASQFATCDECYELICIQRDECTGGADFCECGAPGYQIAQTCSWVLYGTDTCPERCNLNDIEDFGSFQSGASCDRVTVKVCGECGSN